MSAVKIIFKRSSLLGKRPTGANLEAGEIALNTNSNDPGLFFEVNDGSVTKVGPTAYLPGPPTGAPSLGELWVDRDTKALSIGTEANTWQAVGAPFLGGTKGLTVFVAPEFPNATDSLANDGQTVPFITLNRAVLEVTKNIILDTLRGVSTGNNRYLIVLAPGQHCVVNRPGLSVVNFTYDLTDQYQNVTQDLLAAFNPESVGGLILPRGVSVIGMDLKKCEVRPSYVPKYTFPGFPADYTQVEGGPVYQNEPLSSVFRWSGNTYLSNFTGQDKVEVRTVTRVSVQANTLAAVFRSNRPHGLNYNDFVNFEYSNSADQVGSTFLSGEYYAYPLNNYEFVVSVTNWQTDLATPVLASSLPASYLLPSDQLQPKFVVSNVYPYYVPPAGDAYELHDYSHHRLSLVKNATLSQLNNFYAKVQKAFPSVFGGQVVLDLTSQPEWEIVAEAPPNYPNNLEANSTDNSSPYMNMVNLRSDYGMANGDFDGSIISGFKSVIVNSSTAVALQKDPVAYEVYSTSGQNWIQLTDFTQQGLPGSLPITSIPTQTQLDILNETSIPDIRYYYTTLTVVNPSDKKLKSTGLADPENDFRHFGFRVSGSNAYLQAQSVYTIGPAVAVWAKGGALISLTNSTSNFGSVAFQADGFSGIGTLGGANDINKNFVLSGIFRPLRLLEESVVTDQQKRILYLGSKILRVETDPTDPNVQLIYLQRPFDPASILPYSLKPGSAVFTTDGFCTFRAFFVTDGSPTCILTAGDGAILRVRLSDSTIPAGDAGVLDIPYIRRFIDPRSEAERSYGFYLETTNPTTQAPQVGSILRLNQTGQSLSNTIKRNYQFDPGQYGGFGQVFTVDNVETGQSSCSLNFNYKISDSTQAESYVVYSTVTDYSYPWVQSVPSDPSSPDSPLVPFNTPQGSYLVSQNKNYYAAENNLWTSLYYETNFNLVNGPTKVAPEKPDSPYVLTSALEKTELVVDSWQGIVPDPYYTYYTEVVPSPFKDDLSYMRGAVIPFQEYAVQYQVDDDDSSPSFGIIFNTTAVEEGSTVLVSDSFTVQTPTPMSSPFVTDSTFGRPQVDQLELLSVLNIVLPKEGISILQLSNPAVNAVEFVRVISVTSTTLKVIRNYYPQYSVGTLPGNWGKGTVVKTCVSSGYPEPSVYDPIWSPTKATMLRFFQLMGYAPSLVLPYLEPKYSGERLLLNSGLSLSPLGGYANTTSSWPVEFNNPSTILANTHTWQYAGYLDYSRGLPKYQVNEITKKLSYDYLSTTSWGGRLTVTGVNELGQMVFQGPIKEAVTAKYFSPETPTFSPTNRQVYTSPTPVEFPNPIIVYSVDDISGQFDGATQSFPLTRGGYPIPSSQLSEYGVFVFVGGVAQKPMDSYILSTNVFGVLQPVIQFTEAPPEGASCDIRVVTSDDNEQTIRVVSFSLDPDFDGSTSSFNVTPADAGLTTMNSFVFLSGVEQNPIGLNQSNSAYVVDYTPPACTLSFIGGSPVANTVNDVRGIVPGEKYKNAGVSTVFVESVDDISPTFNNTTRSFPLTIGGVPVDATKVFAENMFVSLGGVMQIPYEQAGNPSAGLTYSVSVNTSTSVLEITFSVAPALGTTCNIRVVTSDEFLTCPLPPQLVDTTLKNGPGLIVDDKNQIIAIDSGLVQP
jgi:hypothetical protein